MINSAHEDSGPWSSSATTPTGRETAFFFGREGHRKFGIFHAPRGGSAARSPILVVHPHFDEKLRAHRVLVGTARAFAAKGHPVLRFDLSGHGDSEGEFEDFGFDDLEADVDEAAAWLTEETGSQPVLAGLRMGATLAGRAAGRLGLRALLWQPILEFRPWVDELLRLNLSFQLTHHGKVVKGRNQLMRELESGETVLCEGYGLTPRFYREATASGWLDGLAFPARASSLLAVEIALRPQQGPSRLEAAVESWSKAAPSRLVRIAEEAFWGNTRRHRVQSPELVEASLRWINA